MGTFNPSFESQVIAPYAATIQASFPTESDTRYPAQKNVASYFQNKQYQTLLTDIKSGQITTNKENTNLTTLTAHTATILLSPYSPLTIITLATLWLAIAHLHSNTLGNSLTFYEIITLIPLYAHIVPLLGILAIAAITHLTIITQNPIIGIRGQQLLNNLIIAAWVGLPHRHHLPKASPKAEERHQRDQPKASEKENAHPKHLHSHHPHLGAQNRKEGLLHPTHPTHHSSPSPPHHRQKDAETIHSSMHPTLHPIFSHHNPIRANLRVVAYHLSLSCSWVFRKHIPYTGPVIEHIF